MRLPPQIPTTLFKRSKFWEKVEGGGGRGESSLLSGFQNGSPVANLYSLERGGGRGTTSKVFHTWTEVYDHDRGYGPSSALREWKEHEGEGVGEWKVRQAYPPASQ